MPARAVLRYHVFTLKTHDTGALRRNGLGVVDDADHERARGAARKLLAVAQLVGRDGKAVAARAGEEEGCAIGVPLHVLDLDLVVHGRHAGVANLGWSSIYP